MRTAMKKRKDANPRRKTRNSRRPGFTMIELLVGSSVMLIVIIGALALYQRSNKVAVDQNMYAELQHDVRSAMYLISRDIRMAGVGMAEEFIGYYLEGTDNEDQGASVEVRPDRLKILGNLEDPLDATISQYQGSSANATVLDFTFENHPYEDSFYDNKYVLVLPNPASGCLAGEFRQITHVTHDSGGTNERFNFSPGQAPGIDPPGGLAGTCPSSNDYDGGKITFINVIEYWLDQTGHYPGLSAGVNGYIGGGEANILYMTMNGTHYPLAQNVENLQFEYNGDMNNDGLLDGFWPWQTTWIMDDISRIRQVRVFVLGRTARPFVSVSGRASADIHLYRRPLLSNDPAGLGVQDRHKRFLLESTSSVRNMSIGLYNTGTR
jgi:prepilin-type N-terminal cleavage/methylation domain-containing protein